MISRWPPLRGSVSNKGPQGSLSFQSLVERRTWPRTAERLNALLIMITIRGVPFFRHALKAWRQIAWYPGNDVKYLSRPELFSMTPVAKNPVICVFHLPEIKEENQPFISSWLLQHVVKTAKFRKYLWCHKGRWASRFSIFYNQTEIFD